MGMLRAKNLNNKSGKRVEKDVILHTIILNDNKIDYVYWDDPNKLVNLRLLEVSCQADYNAPITKYYLLSRSFVKLTLL